jgi:hypothetical protein
MNTEIQPTHYKPNLYILLRGGINILAEELEFQRLLDKLNP